MKQTQALVQQNRSNPKTTTPDPKQVEALAYQLWIMRGRPIGSPQVDWLRAEEELRNAQYRSEAA